MVRPGAPPARVRARSMPRVRAGTGEEPGMIESMGQFIGVGLGVVGLSFIAGAQSKKGDDGDYSDEAVSAPKPKSSTSTSANKPSMPKQTIAGGVAGANNRKKAFPGMPKPAVESGAQGGSPNNQSSMPSMPAIDVANTVKELMGGAGAGLSGSNNRGNNKLSYKWGAAEAMGPREYMEDAWAVKDSGFAGGYFFASIMDGHGGEASSAWLRENLFKSLSDKCEGKRASGTIGTAVQDGTPGGGYLADALKAGYESADER